MKKFIIITPRATSPAETPPRIHPPLGAISVLAEVKRNSYKTLLLDVTAEGIKKNILNASYNPITVEKIDGIRYWKTGLRIKEVVSMIAKISPSVIGISCCTIVDRGETAKMTDVLKKTFPTIPIILGGHEASQWYEEILSKTPSSCGAMPSVDYVVVGAGQPVINRLLQYIAKPSTNKIPRGVAYRHNGKVIFTGLPKFRPNQFAVPDYGLLPHIKITNRKKPLDLYSYIGNLHAGRINTLLGTKNFISCLPLLSSYGCGFNCSFCDTSKILVRYSVKNVMKIINKFESLFGVDYIDFMDNNFGGGNSSSRTTAFKILSEIAKKKYQIGFSNGLTFESMHRNDFELLKQFQKNNNVRHMAFPCENGNDRILCMINKPHTLKLVNEVLVFVKKNLRTTNREGFFIGGFPETNNRPAETPGELEKTYQFIKKCLKQELLDQAIFLTLSPVSRTYRLLWRNLYPNAPFEHCLFSQKTDVWPYPNKLLDKMHLRVKLINKRLSKTVTRKL